MSDNLYPSFYSKKVMDHIQNPRNMGEIKNPDGVGTEGNPVCVAPETLVMTNSNITPISQVKIGKKVLSHDGFFHKVMKIYKRPYQGKIYKLRVHNLGEVLITSEHHILSSKTSNFTHKFIAFKKGKFILDWNRVDELEKGDFIAYPIPKEVKDVPNIDFKIPIPKWDFTSKKLPKEIPINSKFLRIAGYYLAEGYVRTDRSKGTLGFVFGAHELEYIADVCSLMKNVFRLDPSRLITRSNSTNILFYSARLARFFSESFGKGAYRKKLPGWVMSLPLEKQREILNGLWRGDGYINPDRKVSKFVTISPVLANQVKLLLLRQKIIFSFLVSPEKGIHKKHYSFYVKDENSLIKLGEITGKKLYFPEKKKNPRKTWFANGFYYAPIWKIEKEQFRGSVFNLEIDKAHSYLVGAAVLHNCGDVMRLFIKIEQRTKNKGQEEEYIKDIKFQTLGCGAAIASSSMLTTMVKGKPLGKAEKITREAIAEALGGLSPTKIHCSVLAADALKKAIADYRKKKK